MIDRNFFINRIETKFQDLNAINKMKEQLDNYFLALENYKLEKNNYQINDKVKLKKGTLMHGTIKNGNELQDIKENGILASILINDRQSKYPSAVGVWNLKWDISLQDYINFYSGGTLEMLSIKGERKTKVIPYNEMQNIIEEISKDDFIFRWKMEQTKEARFMPSLVQNKIQIAFIINGNNEYIENLKKGDILNQNYLDDNIVKNFVNENYYEQFIKERQNKDDFFTNRESAILFGIPSCFIEGILVGREYEKNSNILKEIKKIFPECYICNLDGLVIRV